MFFSVKLRLVDSYNLRYPNQSGTALVIIFSTSTSEAAVLFYSPCRRVRAGFAIVSLAKHPEILVMEIPVPSERETELLVLLAITERTKSILNVFCTLVRMFA